MATYPFWEPKPSWIGWVLGQRLEKCLGGQAPQRLVRRHLSVAAVIFPCGKAGAGEEGNEGVKTRPVTRRQEADHFTAMVRQESVFQVLGEETGRASTKVQGEGAEGAPDHALHARDGGRRLRLAKSASHGGG